MTTNSAEKLIEQAIRILDQAEIELDSDKTNASDQTTEIVIILDRSGSMASMQEDMEGGLNSFVAEQRLMEGNANLTLVQFDHEHELVHDRINIVETPTICLIPRGCTALLDAVGRTLCAQLEKIPHDHSCVVIICTDGHENASQEFSKAQVLSLIENCRTKRDWQFIFLGANQDAFSEAGGIGIRGSRAINYDNNRAREAMGLMSSKVARYREHRHPEFLDFTTEEREVAMPSKDKE